MIAWNPQTHHALAFSWKHHEGQMRKSRRVGYIVHPMEVALVLANYRCNQVAIIAGILHDVLEDCAKTNAEQRVLEEKIGNKFGRDVLRAVLGVTEVKRDDRDQKVGTELRRRLYLEALAEAPEESWWVCAADKVCNGNDVLTDLLHADDRDAIWNAFSGGKEAVVRWYRAVHTRLSELGFAGEIMYELGFVASRLESAAITHVEALPRPGA